MRLSGDYSGEMDRVSSDEAQVIERIRGSLLRAPTPEVAAAHMVAMATAAARNAAPAELEERGNDMRSFTKKRTVVLAAAAVLALGAGLAAAVTLPDQASDRAEQAQAEKAAGTNGQPSIDSSAHGDAVSAVAHDDSVQGCEHGRAVSDVASSKAADDRNSDGPRHDPCEKNDNAGPNRAKGKARGHGEPPGRKLGHAKQDAAKAGQSSKIKSSGGAGSQGADHRSDGSGKSKGSTVVESDPDGATSEPSPAPEPSPTPTTEPSPTV
jgi:hypothetical protein